MEWTGDPCIDMLGILLISNSPIAIVFIVAGTSRNAAIICSASASSLTSIDASGVKVYAGLRLFWCPQTCTRNMPESID